MFRRTKRSTYKYGKLPDKLEEEIPQNKLYVDLTGLYKMRIKYIEPLILKAFTMIYPVTGWFELTQFNDKKSMTIANLVKTMWLDLYPWPVKITYDRGREFLSHEFKICLIEQYYRLETKPAYSGNPQENTTIERIHQVIGNHICSYNLQETYVDDSDPWMGIISADFLRHGVHTNGLNKKSSPIGFWVIHNTPNQSYSELNTHTSEETNTDKKDIILEDSAQID